MSRIQAIMIWKIRYYSILGVSSVNNSPYQSLWVLPIAEQISYIPHVVLWISDKPQALFVRTARTAAQSVGIMDSRAAPPPAYTPLRPPESHTASSSASYRSELGDLFRQLTSWLAAQSSRHEGGGKLTRRSHVEHNVPDHRFDAVGRVPAGRL